MPREKQGYRETIQLMTEAGIGFLVTQQELAQFCHCDTRTIQRRYPELKGRWPLAKTAAARAICG